MGSAQTQRRANARIQHDGPSPWTSSSSRLTVKASETVIIGAGQAGLATSYELLRLGIPHCILEKGRIGEAWHSQRWDSFWLVTPNWTITLPGAPYDGPDPEGFLTRDAWLSHLTGYAALCTPDIRTGVTVNRLTPDAGGFRLDTSDGPMTARTIVVATGTHQDVRRPALWHHLEGQITQLPATDYRNPGQIGPGGVLVIGSGQSGCQIAEELHAAGRPTWLCVGSSGRLPRRYRGRDCIDWQNRMGWLDRTPAMLDSPARRFRGDPHVTGQNGGRTISLHRMAASGITLLGRLVGAEGATLRLAPDLAEGLLAADAYALKFCRDVDEFIARAGIDAPASESADALGFGSGPVPDAPAELDLRAAGITTVIWATGFGFDFSWIDAPVCDSFGYPESDRGVSAVPGLYFMGLNWMARRKSGIIFGVGEDAAHIAAHIAATRG